ncbi:GlxA family transcriptional regulator [Glaciecola sp. 2405UD65-10]|uniref:GlxA family transcriptional regulator n=1 Tax=Glaciecola sp. 2405UD65-10 TaxID=3397244 RepID=UPI003B5A3C9E
MPYFKPFKVIIVGFDGALASALTGALDLFSFTGVSWQRFSNQELEPRFTVEIASLYAKPFRCSNRLVIQAHCDLNDVTECDLVLVPTIGDSLDKTIQANLALIPHLKRLAKTQADIASNCSGAFLLAEAGLLNNKPATTHWGYAEKLKTEYPLIDVQDKQLVTQSDNIFCAAGGSSFYDLGLLLIERYCGREIANQVAKTQVIDSRRSDQRVYANTKLFKRHPDPVVAQTQDFIELHYKQNLNVADLAQKVSVTTRTLNRRFQAAINLRPIEYIQAIRVEQAKRLLETGQGNIKSLANLVGYEDTSSFTRLFKKTTLLTPKEYQDKFYRASI